MIPDNAAPLNPADKLVLIIEDDEAFNEFLELVVKSEGFTVEKAFDGEAGLWKAQNLSPDLILLDLMLPKFGGFEILKALQTEKSVNIPVVILTGAASEFSKEAKFKREPNVRGFMRKPIKVQDLTALLHTILNTSPSDPHP
jgi:two-component system alkaline phosphatase synthesis response regulator PhoP